MTGMEEDYRFALLNAKATILYCTNSERNE